MKRSRRASGAARSNGSMGKAFALLLVLLGLGGWNYHRSLERERAEHQQSAFAGYGQAGLESLRAAYQAELEGLGRELAVLERAGGGVRDTAGLGEAVREFERVQRGTRRLREVTTEVATREARIREIDEELRRRAHAGRGLVVHLERLIGAPIPL